MIDNMGWGTFLLWGLFDIVIACYAWFGLIETRGKTLEDISRPAAGKSDSGVDDAVDDRDTSKVPQLSLR